MNNSDHFLRSVLKGVGLLLLSVLWSEPSPAAVHRGLFIQESHSVSVAQSEFSRVVVSYVSNRLALVSAENTIRVFDAGTLAEQPVLLGAEGQISALTFAADGQFLIAGTADGKVYTWNIATGAITKTFNPQSVAINGLDALKGSQVLTTASDGNLEVDDWMSGDKVSSLSKVNEQITCQVVHPSGKWCVFGTSVGRLHVYDIAQSQDVKVLSAAVGKITALAISPDGRFLVSGSSDGGVRTWDAGRWMPRNNFFGQRGDVTSLTVDPKSRWVAATAKDSTMKIYNLFTGEQLKSITESNGYYSFVSFLNEKSLCTATSAGLLRTLLVLEVPPDSLPPTVMIKRPMVDVNTTTAKVYEKEYPVEGVAYDDSIVAKVTVNGEQVQLFDLDASDTLGFPPGVKTKGFKSTVRMDSVGFSQVEIKAFDACENVFPVNLSVQRVPKDEVIEVIAPVDSGDVDRISTRLKFKLWVDASSFTVSNNFLEIAGSREMRNTIPGELISVPIPLVVGYNQIQIAATGKKGERFAKSVGVTRKMSMASSTSGPKGPIKPTAVNPGENRGVGMQRWAVIVGISRYGNADVAQLNYADADAKDFADFLQTPEGGGFENDHMRVLLNQDATLANVREALFNFASQAIDSDLVIIYFAGHGAPNPLRPDQLYLLTHDSDPNNLRTTAFPMWDIQTVLDRYINARKVVVITDACHSGGISSEVATRGLTTGKSNPINQYLANLAKAKDGVVVFTASAQNEVSQELPEFSHGVFTYYLLDGLKGNADLNNDKVVTINELMTYVEVQVKRKTKGYQNPTRSQTNYDKELPMSIIPH